MSIDFLSFVFQCKIDFHLSDQVCNLISYIIHTALVKKFKNMWIFSSSLNSVLFILLVKKSRIRETKHLLTDVNSSTDNTVGCKWNIQKPDFFKKQQKSSKTQKLKNFQKYAKTSNTPFNQRSLIHWEVLFPGGPRIPKHPNFWKKTEKIIQNKKTQKCLEIWQNQQYTL